MKKLFSMKWNTLRGQMLSTFALVMVIVLSVVGFLTFNLVTEIIKDNAKNQIEQTAAQSLGRIDSQFETIEMIASQIATNPSVQNLLIQEMRDEEATFAERQSMNEIINSYQAYTTGLTSFELYFRDGRRLFPLSELPLGARLAQSWIEEVQEENGRLVWAGADPFDSRSYLAVNQINLIDEDFDSGGYLITKVNENFFDLSNAAGSLNDQEAYAIVLDGENSEVAGNLPENIDRSLIYTGEESAEIDGEEFVRVAAESSYTGWSIVIFTPVNNLLQGIAGIGTAVAVAGLTGLVIFIAASWLVSSYISRPIRQLTHAMRFGTIGALRKSQRISSTAEITELNETYNKMVEKTNHLIKAVYEEELLKTRAELKALQAQINPHFLFNTLEAIYWTLEEKDEETADVIISLSSLFRYTISDVDDDDRVSLKEELDQVERYLQIMKLRFADRLTWHISYNETLLQQRLPKLLIQPVIENALVHGIGERVSGGVVDVNVENALIPGYMQITVKDNGQGIRTEQLEKIRASIHEKQVMESKGTGLAMRNLYQRIALSYQDDPHAGLYIESTPGEGTSVMIILPIKGADKNATPYYSDR
jgi:two-component system, sensor histidine kinase YesM